MAEHGGLPAAGLVVGRAVQLVPHGGAGALVPALAVHVAVPRVRVVQAQRQALEAAQLRERARGVGLQVPQRELHVAEGVGVPAEHGGGAGVLRP